MSFHYYDFYIKEVELQNFRKFDYLHITFDPHITALTAPNGGGKSAVLAAVAVGISHFVNSLNPYSGITGFAQDDHRLLKQQGSGMTPAPDDVKIICRGNVCNEAHEWSRERTYKPNAKTRIANAQCLQAAAKKIILASTAADSSSTAPYPIAPLVLFYDTQRLSLKQRLTEKRKPQRADRFEGYGDCLTSGSYIRIFKDWYKALSAQYLQEASESPRKQLIKKQLTIVNQAVSSALSPVGWQNLSWDFIRNDLTMTHPQIGTLCFSQLSDGIRNILNLVADIAHRAVRINPMAPHDLLAHIRGIVLIDEIDMYLHPQWQQQIIKIFRQIFPCIQFIISTHSPQVLSTLRKEQIRIIGDNDGQGYADIPTHSPYAHASSKALAEIFAVNPIPLVTEQQDIAKVQQLYRSGRFEEAEALQHTLAAQGIDFEQQDIDFWKLLAAK
ncbi:MAG: hypothetical protein E7033_05230 [Akkermansiaceae bacterium]|nr:hypothetical protein [Akkermansiaceae bacterium]